MPAVRGIGMEAWETLYVVGSGGARGWGEGHLVFRLTYALRGTLRVPACVSAQGLDSIFQAALFPCPLGGRRS